MPEIRDCPFCQHEYATPVKFTAWGGFVGPRVLSLVQCGNCGSHFNGRTGGKAQRAIKIYAGVTLAILGLVAAGALYCYLAPAGHDATKNQNHPPTRMLNA